MLQAKNKNTPIRFALNLGHGGIGMAKVESTRMGQ